MGEQEMDRSRGYAGNVISMAMVVLSFVSGIIYVWAEWTTVQKIRDSVFVSLLIAATMILVFGIRILFDYLKQRGQAFYSFVLASDNPEKAYTDFRAFYQAVTNVRSMTAAGVIYGLVVGSAPFVLRLWKEHSTLALLLAIFLLCVNFVTGVAFFGLLTFFRRSLAMGRLIKVNLFHIENPSTGFLLGATRRIAVLASIYISLSLTSMLFSGLPAGSLVIAYAVFALSILLASLGVPLIPIVRRLKEAKANHISEIDSQIDKLFQELLRELREGKMDQDLSKLNSLIQLKECVQAINIVPFRMKSITAAASVLFCSSVPLILQWILTRYF
jgi:hypothetical protein